MLNPSIFSAIKKYRELLTKEEKLQWFGIFVFALTTSFLEILTTSIIVIFSKVLIEPEIGKQYLEMSGFLNNLSPIRTVFYITLLVGLVYVIKNLVNTVEVFYQNLSIQKMSYQLKNRLLYRYAEVDYNFYLTRNSALGMQVIGSDVEQMFSCGIMAVANILSEMIVSLSLISMIVYINPFLAVVIFSVGALLYFVVTRNLLPNFYRFGQKLQEALLYSGQNLAQFFYAFKEVILLGKRKSFIELYQIHSYQKSRIQTIQGVMQVIPRMVIEVLFVGFFVTTVAFLCLKHESPVKMIGVLGGYLYTGFRLMPGLNRIVNQLSILKSVTPSIERVYQEYTTLALKENYLDVPNLQFNKFIKLQKVYFKYLNTEKDALLNISLEIKKGEAIGIIGKTGSGKSTLVDLILGLLKPYTGSILVDDQYPLNCYQWHQKIGYVPQNISLIDATIEENIAFGEDKIDQKMLDAVIDASQLRQFINLLPLGVKTTIGERGMRLSGGERQRISIARALYHNPEILIFDEATSALDNDTEDKLMNMIQQISADRTIIMIAHRLSTLKNCDRIIILEKGTVKKVTNYHEIETGTVQYV